MQENKRVAVGAIASVILVLSAAQIAGGEERIRAFPGAEGFGAYAAGGRGGKVLFVTHLQDYDPQKENPVAGSLRAAIEAKGPRTVVFRVSGTIPLKSRLVVKEPFITLAGQSAPGDGICTKNHEVLVRTHDVIVRYLRFRPGDELGRSLATRGQGFACDALSITAFPDPAPDPVTKGPSVHNIIFDHCSASWGSDEVLSIFGPYISNITVQWCIMSESLTQSTHGKGAHGMASLLRCDGDVSFHHNLYAHHRHRLPRAGTYGDGNGQKSLLLDFRNNVIYGSGLGYTGKDAARINYVGNYIKAGFQKEHIFSIGGHATWMYIADNYVDEFKTIPPDQWGLVKKEIERNKRHDPFAVEPVTTEAAAEAYEKVLALCGATRPKRDAVDDRVVNQVHLGSGQCIDSQQEVGGWPTLESAPAPGDKDHDGMPDAWESRYGLNPSDRSDAVEDTDNDGYTNIEEWLNGTDPGRWVVSLDSKGKNRRNLLSMNLLPVNVPAGRHILAYLAESQVCENYFWQICQAFPELSLA